MEWLRRSAAPVSEKVWKEVDDIAGGMFKQTIVARRIADFDGPRGWNHVATQLGTFKPAQAPQSSGKVRFLLPDVVLLTELRADFQLPWADIDIFERVGPRLESRYPEGQGYAPHCALRLVYSRARRNRLAGRCAKTRHTRRQGSLRSRTLITTLLFVSPSDR